MNRPGQVLSPVSETGYRSIRHRNSSPAVKPRTNNVPRRSCDGSFAFLSAYPERPSSSDLSSSRSTKTTASNATSATTNGSSPSNSDSTSPSNPYASQNGLHFRPRVNTLPDALNGVNLFDERRERHRSQSYTPSTGMYGNRRRRKSQERTLDADNWNNYRKTSIDPRKFSISDTNDVLPERDDKVYRVLVLGADKVGKTTLLHQLIRQEEMEKLSRRERSIKMLIPIDTTDIAIIFDNQPFNDELLDDRVNHEKVYYDSVIVIYSITDRRSFEIAAQLLTMAIFDYKRLNPDLKACLIGNKSDLVRARAVDPCEGKSLANRFEVDFYEASIELEDNLDQILNWISNNVRTHFGFMPKSDHGHGKFHRALSFVKRVLRKPEFKHKSCEAINAI